MERVYVDHIKEILGKNEEVTIINVLPREDFQKERIAESINIPYENSDQFLQDVERIVPSKNHEIIVHCSKEECELSETAAKALDKAKYARVMDFSGGMKEWKEAGEKVISEIQ